MTSLHHDAIESTNVSVNGQNSPVELDAEWSEQEYEQARRTFFEQGSRYAVLPSEIILDQRFTKHSAVLIAMAAMSTLAVGDMLMVSQTELARRLGVTQQAMSKTMAKAEEFGYVQRLAGPTTQARWRLRWLTSRLPQPQVVSSQPQVVSPQPEVVSPQPEVVSSSRARARSTSSSLSTSPVKSSSKKLVVTDEERAWLHKRYDDRLGPVWVDEQIEMCLGYKGTQKHSSMKLACNNWLAKACEQVDRARAAKTNKEAAEMRLRAAKGEPTHNPLVSEPAPWLGKSIWEIEAANPSRDRTHD